MMQWPLVFRSTHDALMAGRAETIAALRADLAAVRSELGDARREHAAFVALIAERTAPSPKPQPPVQREDPVAQAVAQKAAGNGALRAHLFRFAASARADGASENDIVRRILDWSQPEGVESADRDRREAEAVVAGLLD